LIIVFEKFIYHWFVRSVEFMRGTENGD